ncbi:MAG: ABC transporter ATP-binding protein [Desulfobacterales bacterium]|nr:MAG: ABC transporter ATP-binding protein [Desulfobacterales bacterium]
MTEPVIKAENLSKQYRLGATQGYKTFREAIANATKALFRNFGKSNPQSAIRNPQSDTIWALKDVSFEVKQGEVIGIIGRNGAGKSTLLKILSKITKPTSGRVELKGRVGSLLEVGTGFHPELTGHENIYLYGAILGMDRWEVTRKFDEIVAFAGLEKFVDTPVKRYSSGMCMRLAFAVAAHLEPEILLVDEVLAVGDVAFQKKCLGKMGNIAEEGRTVLFVSHNMGALSAMCQKGLLIEQGQIVYNGEVKSAIEQYFKRLESRSHLELSKRQDRKGSGACRFTRLTFEDESGQPLNTFRSGQSVRVVLDYESNYNSNLHAVKAAISIDHHLYGEIFYCDSLTTGDLIHEIPSNGRLVCTVDSLPLIPGSYSKSVFLKVGSQIVDWITGAATISVEEDDLYGTGKLPTRGIVLLPSYSWSTVEN